MKAVVIYKSKTGFVKKYAEWIAAALPADLMKATGGNAAKLKAYDTIIFGGSLHAVGINGLKLLKKRLPELEGGKIAVFATGASPYSDKVLDELLRANFTPEEQRKIKLFYLRGGFDFRKLPPMDKLLMSLLRWKLRRKQKRHEPLNGDERGMLAAFAQPADFTEKKDIEPLLAYVKAE